MPPPLDDTAVDGIEYVLVDGADTGRILEVHALLRAEMGVEAVEEIDSFRDTVSLSTDAAVVPSVLCALYQERVVGAIVGAYLTNVNMGMVLYSAVRESLRGRGIYSALKPRLIHSLNAAARRNRTVRAVPGGRPTRIEFLVSEVDGASWLGKQYVRRWSAFVAPCDYEQPEAQGLKPRALDLVFLPIGKCTPPSGSGLVAIIREIYERIYRLPDVTQSSQFRRVVQSMASSGRSRAARARLSSALPARYSFT